MEGKELRELREGLHLSQQALAVRLGVAVATVYRWETGKRRIPPYLAPAVRELAVTVSPAGEAANER